MFMFARFLLGTIFLASHSHALAYTWIFEDVLIETVTAMHDGGHSIYQIKLQGNLPVTNCPPTDSTKVVSLWTESGSPADVWDTMYSTALTAQAQGLPVDIYVNEKSCNTSKGMGLNWRGIRIHKQ